MSHGHMAGSVKHTLIDQDAAGRRKVLEYRAIGYFHGITDT